MEQKELFTARIMRLLDEYAAAIPEVSTAEMPQPEFAAIVEKWHLSNGFLKKFLPKAPRAHRLPPSGAEVSLPGLRRRARRVII